MAARAFLALALLLAPVFAAREDSGAMVLEALDSNSTATCETWCATKVNGKQTTCKANGKDNQLCTWPVVCGYSSGKCSACTECKPTPKCEDWCTSKVTQKLKTCKVNGVENQLCTWDALCAYSSLKCAACDACKPKPKCEDWCASKVTQKLKTCTVNGKTNQLCTWTALCSYSSLKCSACSQCKKPVTPVKKTCEDWCASKVTKKERTCTVNGNSNYLCTWSAVCGYSSGKCAGCSQCKAASKNSKNGASGRAVVGAFFLAMSSLVMNMF